SSGGVFSPMNIEHVDWSPAPEITLDKLRPDGVAPDELRIRRSYTPLIPTCDQNGNMARGSAQGTLTPRNADFFRRDRGEPCPRGGGTCRPNGSQRTFHALSDRGEPCPYETHTKHI